MYELFTFTSNLCNCHIYLSINLLFTRYFALNCIKISYLLKCFAFWLKYLASTAFFPAIYLPFTSIYAYLPVYGIRPCTSNYSSCFSIDSSYSHVHLTLDLTTYSFVFKIIYEQKYFKSTNTKICFF